VINPIRLGSEKAKEINAVLSKIGKKKSTVCCGPRFAKTADSYSMKGSINRNAWR
jgi:hypothetical protein